MNDWPGGCVRITDGVLLTGSALRAALYAVETAQRFRSWNGSPPLRALDELRWAMSPPGQTDTPSEPAGHCGVVVEMTTEEAAGLLPCSVRTVRRLAPALGGRLVGGRWILDRQAVIEHIEGRDTP